MQKTAVLVVDDDFDFRESMVDLFEERGRRALSAKDGRDGIYELRASPDVGLVLLDLDMPMMDGENFRREQLADPKLAGVPLIVLSAHEHCLQKASQLGAAAALKKPFTIDALMGLIAEVESGLATAV